MKLAVIGGGDLQDSNHLPINERLIELTNKQYPKILFIPTASHDDESYIKLFLDTFEKQLHCEVQILRTTTDSPSKYEIDEMIHSADLIYLGGGTIFTCLRNGKNIDSMKNYYWLCSKEHLLLVIALVLCVGSRLVSDQIMKVLVI